MTAPSTFSTTIMQSIPGRENCLRITTSQSTSGDWSFSHFAWSVIGFFREDLFQYCGEEKRPPYRWMVIGPARLELTYHGNEASIAFKGQARVSTLTHWAPLLGMPLSLVISAGASSPQKRHQSWFLVGRVRRRSAGTRLSTLAPGTQTGQPGLRLLSAFNILARRLWCPVGGGMWL